MGRRTGPAYPLDPSVEQETWYDASPDSDTLSFQPITPFLGDFTPWQIVVSTLTAVYAMRNADKLIGLGGESSLPIRKPREAQFPLRFGQPPSPTRASCVHLVSFYFFPVVITFAVCSIVLSRNLDQHWT